MLVCLLKGIVLFPRIGAMPIGAMVPSSRPITIRLRHSMFDKVFELLTRKKGDRPRPAPTSEAEALKTRGNKLLADGELSQAEECFRQAIAVDPRYADAYNNLGIVLWRRGAAADARDCLEKAIQINPRLANAHYNLGALLRDIGNLEAAAVHFGTVLECNPEFAAAYLDLAQVHVQRGELDAARSVIAKGIEVKPDFAEFHINLGNLHMQAGDLAQAAASYQQTLARQPDNAEVQNNLGSIHWNQGRPEQALACYRAALAIQPEYAEAHCNLGMVLHTQGKLSEAIASYRTACSLNPEYADAYYKLGHVLYESGDFAGAKRCYQLAQDLNHPGAMVRQALMLPPILGTRREILEQRDEFRRNLDSMIAAAVTIDDPLAVGTANFYLAFQGLDDRDLQVKVAEFYEQACPALLYAAPHCCAPKPSPRRRIRVGFLSKFVFTHSVSRCVSRIVEDLSTGEDFEVMLISSHDVDDKDYRSTYARFSGQRVHLPLNLAQAREKIAALELDVLVYLDIGMEPLSFFLAFARLAPVQCVWAGHPVTTGIANLDYFLSAAAMEPADADRHYSEKLVRFPRGMFYFERPTLPSALRTRRELGLPETKHVYMCPMALQKIHPDFDEAMTRILDLDAEGMIVLFADGRYPHWQRLLEERFAKTLTPGIRKRVKFLPWLSDYSDFISAVAAADVILDPFHFGIGSTAIATFAVGTPLVTLPGKFMRGRMGLAYCTMMGLDECVAEDVSDYARKAVAFSVDKALRHSTRTKILENSRSFYDNPAPIADLANFFRQAVDAADQSPSGRRKSRISHVAGLDVQEQNN